MPSRPWCCPQCEWDRRQDRVSRPLSITGSLAAARPRGRHPLHSPGPHERRPELKALTGLRAVAAIAVVMSHVGVPKGLPEEFAKIAHWGYIGVPLFFMLSGVVLGYNYPQLNIRQTRRMAKFYL